MTKVDTEITLLVFIYYYLGI